MRLKHLLLLAILSLPMCALAGQDGKESGADAKKRDQVLKTEKERDDAMQKADLPTLDRIYGDEVTIQNTQGKHLNKADRMANFKAGELKFLSFDQGDYAFHIYGNTVIVTGQANSAVEYHGVVNRVPRRFTLTYIKIHGKWQLVAQSETLIQQPQ